MGTRSIVQIGLIVIAIVMIFSFVRPTMAEIGVLQDELSRFEGVLESARTANERVMELDSKMNQFTQRETISLNRFLPDTLDTVFVMRDIGIIAVNNGLLLQSVSGEVVSASDEDIESQAETEVAIPPVTPLEVVLEDVQSGSFSFSVAGNYGNIKSFLQDLERNYYQLRITSFELKPSATEESDTFTLSGEVLVHAFQ